MKFQLAVVLLAAFAAVQVQAQCAQFCGGFAAPFGCWCDDLCTSFNDCCPDAVAVCLGGGGPCVQPPAGNLPTVLTCPITSTAFPPQLTPSPAFPVTVTGGSVEPICGVPSQPDSVLVATSTSSTCCTTPGGCPTFQSINVNGKVISKTVNLPGAPAITDNNVVSLNQGFSVTVPQNFVSELKLYQFTTTAFNCKNGPTCPPGEAPSVLSFGLNNGICPVNNAGLPELCISRCFNFEVVQCLTPCNGCQNTLDDTVGTVFTNPNVNSNTGFPPGPGQCTGFCGGFAAPFGCFCDDLCTSFNDCCVDAVELCLSPPTPGQCTGFCGGFAAPFGCFCDDLCTSFNDCCVDAVELCLSPPTPGQCTGFCGGFAAPFGCFCDDLCTSFNDCCVDAVALCL